MDEEKIDLMACNSLILKCSQLVVSLSLLCCQAIAEPVAVRGSERGQGIIFTHDEHCYLLTAKHVSGGRPRAQVIAEGALSGSASLRFPFWDGLDLAVGIVRRGASERCSGSIDDLKGSGGTIGQSDKAVLVLINDEGFVDRLKMNILETRYLDLEAEFVGSDDTAIARQGMSGGFLFVNGKPVGMAMETIDGRVIRFMRIEEIHQNVSRWIGTQNEIKLPTVADMKETATGSLPLLVTSVSAQAISEEYLPENLLINGESYAFEPKRNAEIIFDVLTDKKATISSIQIRSQGTSGMTMPRRVVIFASSDTQGNRWKTFWSGEMSRDGFLDTGPRAQTWARRIKVVVASGWSHGPMTISSILAN